MKKIIAIILSLFILTNLTVSAVFADGTKINNEGFKIDEQQVVDSKTSSLNSKLKLACLVVAALIFGYFGVVLQHGDNFTCYSLALQAYSKGREDGLKDRSKKWQDQTNLPEKTSE